MHVEGRKNRRVLRQSSAQTAHGEGHDSWWGHNWKSKIGSKSQSLASMPLSAASKVFVLNSNRMNSFAYDMSHSFPSECFASCDENEEETSQELIKAMEDHEIELL